MFNRISTTETTENPKADCLLDKVFESMDGFRDTADLLAHIQQGEDRITELMPEPDLEKRDAIIAKLAGSKHAKYKLRLYGFDQIEPNQTPQEAIKTLHAFLMKIYEEAPEAEGHRDYSSVPLRLLLYLAMGLDSELVNSESGELTPEFNLSAVNIRQIIYRVRKELKIASGGEWLPVVPFDSDVEQCFFKGLILARSIGNDKIADRITRILKLGEDNVAVSKAQGDYVNCLRDNDASAEVAEGLERRLFVRSIEEFDALRRLADSGNRWAKTLVDYSMGALRGDVDRPLVEGKHPKNLSHIFSVARAVYRDPELGLSAIESQDLVCVASTIADRITESEFSLLKHAFGNAVFCSSSFGDKNRKPENFALWRYRAMSCETEEFLRRRWLVGEDVILLRNKGVDEFCEQCRDKFLSQDDIDLFKIFFKQVGGVAFAEAYHAQPTNEFLMKWEYFRFNDKILLTDSQINNLAREINDRFEQDNLRAVLASVSASAIRLIQIITKRRCDKKSPDENELRKCLTKKSSMPYMVVDKLIRLQKKGVSSLIPGRVRITPDEFIKDND